MTDEDLLQFSHSEGENRTDRRLKRSQVTAERSVSHSSIQFSIEIKN